MNPWENYYGGESLSAGDYATAILPMVSSGLALICGCVIVRECRADMTGAMNSNTSALSLQTISAAIGFGIHALMLLLGPIPAPADIPVFGTSGTTVTCSLQGFFITFGAVVGALTHCGLVWLMKLMVCHNQRDHELRQKLKYTIGAPIPAGFVLALVPTVLGLMNFNGSNCWVFPFPKECTEDEDVDCIRGEMALLVRGLYFVFPSLVVVIAESYLFYCIYQKTRQLEDKVGRYKISWMKSFRWVPANTALDETRTTSNRALSKAMPAVVSPSTLQTEDDKVNRAKSQAVAYQAVQLTLGMTLVQVYVIVETAIQTAADGATGAALTTVDLFGDFLITSFLTILFLNFAAGRRQMKTRSGHILAKILWCCIASCNLLPMCCEARGWGQSARQRRQSSTMMASMEDPSTIFTVDTIANATTTKDSATAIADDHQESVHSRNLPPQGGETTKTTGSEEGTDTENPPIEDLTLATNLDTRPSMTKEIDSAGRIVVAFDV
jgi:hypothetical protein